MLKMSKHYSKMYTYNVYKLNKVSRLSVSNKELVFLVRSNNPALVFHLEKSSICTPRLPVGDGIVRGH